MAATFAVVAGVAVIAGWMFDSVLLKSVVAGWPAMKANTAIALMLSGFGLWSLDKHARSEATASAAWGPRLCGGGAALIGALTAAEHFLRRDFGIDELLFRESLDAAATPFPGRMSAAGAIGLIFLGLALWPSVRRKSGAWFSQALGLTAGFIALICLAGYLYDPTALQRAGIFTSTSLQTSMSLLVLGAGVLCAQPKAAVMAIFTAESAGGQMLRRLLLPVLALPVLLNWLELRGESRGLFPEQFGWMIDAALTVALSGVLVWLVGRSLHGKDSDRLAAEEELRRSEERYRQLVEMSPDAILVKNGTRIEYVNGAGARLLGVSRREDIVGKAPLHFVHHRSRADIEVNLCAVLQEGKALPLVEQTLVRPDGVPVDVELSAAAVDFQGHRAAQLIVRDISERKRLERARQESEERFRLIAETITEVFWMSDVKIERIIYVSPAYERIWGRSCESLYQNPRSFMDAIHPDDRPSVLAELEREKTGRVFDQEYRIIRPDRSVRWIWDRGFPVRNESGETIHYVGVALDVTERKQAELKNAALLALEARLNSADSVEEAARIIVDVADELMGWDACLVGLYHAHRDRWELVLRMDTINEARVTVPWGEPGPPGRIMRQVLSEGPLLILRDQPDETETGLRPFGDEARRSASLMFAPMRVGERVVGIVSIQSYAPHAYTRNDLNTLEALADHCGSAIVRTQSQEALRESEQRFRATFEQAAVGVAHVSTDGRFLRVNEKFCQITGYSREEMLARTFQHITHPDDLQADLGQVRRMLAGDIQAYSMEKRYIRKDGSHVWIELTVSLVRKPDGAPDYFIAVVEEITQRRSLETQLRQAQKMEAIGQLAGGVAHDFNNILAAMMMQSELAAMNEGLPDEVREGLIEIRQAAEKAANLTRQLLVFSRQQVLQPRQLDLNEVIASIARMLRRVLREDIQLRLHLASAPIFLYADGAMLDQVMLNLAVNARDAMPNGGHLVIETAEGVLNAEDPRLQPGAPPGHYARLSVSDTGEGIPSDILPRIFEPFFTTKGPGKGTGLGLATVFGVVKQHRGWLKVYSEVGKGTTFQIFLPALEAPARAVTEETARPEPRGGSETILVVEDDPAVLMMTRLTLERHGYTVLEATNGAEAMRVWEEKRPIALLLTDLVMPGGITGRQLATQLKRQASGLKVVFTSGYSAEIAGRELKLEAGQDFIQKPCPPQQLLETIRKCLDG